MFNGLKESCFPAYSLYLFIISVFLITPFQDSNAGQREPLRVGQINLAESFHQRWPYGMGLSAILLEVQIKERLKGCPPPLKL
jgi:hypothetical protein